MALVFCAAVPARSDDVRLVDFRAEYVWRQIYSRMGNNKAMAVAENGAFGMAFGETDLGMAESKAMQMCTERSKFMSLKLPAAAACQIMASRNDLKSSNLRVDDNWQQPASGIDKPMAKGWKYTVPQSKGIILLVHGCNGLGDKIFTDAWAAYFNALGYDLYAPDSFAVKRPQEVCGVANDFPASQVSEVWRLRIAQTQRTLADLKQANPDKPIYMWGHSEGGLIVQMIETEVSGIIVSGEECGVLGAPIAAKGRVHLLYLWGEYDLFVNGAGFRIDSRSSLMCNARGNGKSVASFAILKGRSHIPWPWNKTANEAIARFLDAAPPGVVGAERTKKLAGLWKRTKPPKTYRNAPGHRAAAINRAGTSYMVWGLDNVEDAINLALFECARATSRSNVFKTGKYLCAVVDANGAPPK